MGLYVDVKLIFGFTVNMFQIAWDVDNSEDYQKLSYDELVHAIIDHFQLPNNVYVAIACCEGIDLTDVIIGIKYDQAVDCKSGYDFVINYPLDIFDIQTFCNKHQTQLSELGEKIGLSSNVQPRMIISSDIE